MQHWLDDISRALVTGGVSRRALLRRLGTGLAAGAVAVVGLRGRRAVAQVAPQRRCLIGAAPNTTYGCPTGQICCPTVDAQGVCCPGGTTCPPPGNPAGPTCSTAFTCANPNTCPGPSCGNSQTCACQPMVEGGGFCNEPQLCANLQVCTSTAQCPPGWACSQTCCSGGARCMPPCGTFPFATIASAASGLMSNGQVVGERR